MQSCSTSTLAAKDKPVGPASDVYAVGAILFEMLSGQPPFDAENPVEVMRRVISETPPPLTRFVRGLPKDLETICRKCLEKDPLRRYRSAEALADDLNRWLVGKPIAARPIGPIGQVVRWSRRNRVVASLLFGVFLALTGGIVVSVGLAIRANRYAVEAERNANLAKANATTARENAERAEANAVTAKAREAAATASEGRANAARAEEAKLRQEADTRERLRARELYDANMSVAHAAWESGHPNHTRLLLDKYLPSHPDKPDPRGFEWFYLSRLTRFRDYTITAPDRIVCGASIPGTVLHAIGLPNAVHIWDPPACKAVHWKARWPGLRSVAFSPDGHVMATGYQHGRIHLFDRTENRAISEATLRESDEFYVISLVFSPNGKTVYAAIGIDTRVTEPTQVVALDVESGKELRRFKGATGSLRGVSLSPDGATLVAGGYDGKVRMWSTATGDSKESIDTGGLISAIAYSPSGKVLATGTARGVVSVWDVATGQLRNELSGHADWADRLAFSGDGRYLATGSRDGIARVWDVATGVPYRAYRGHDRRIAAVGFSNNGRNLFSASEDSTGVLWDTTRDSECVTQRLPNLYGHAAIPLPDKCRALIVSDHCYLQFLDLDTGALSPARTPKGVLANLLAASLSPDGATVALSTYQQGLMLVAVADLAAQPRRIDVPLTTALAWSGDGQSLIVGHRDGGLASIAVDGKSPPRRFGPSRTRVDVVATSRQLPNRVIASCGDGTIRAFDPVTGDEAFTVEVGSHRPTCLTINPDGSRFATGGFDGSVRVWNSATGKLIQRLDGHTNEVTSVAFDGTGLRLATGSFDLTAKLWDVETGLQVLSLRGHSQTVRGVAFGPEGGTFITVGGGEVRLWDARAGMSYERGRLLAAAVRIEPTSAEWKRATGVTANFRLINGSTKSLQAPTLNTNNATFQVGALVERIGPDPTIPALESKRRPHDQRYAVGALTLSMPPMTLEPNGFVEGKITFPADWPAGKYRLYLEHGWDGKAVENAPLAARDFIVPTRDD